jgi:hypothetical protein
VSVAEPVLRKAHFDSDAGPNQYVVNFPESMGGATIFMSILGGTFELETDATAGTARLVTWEQSVGAIELMPGMSTGPITVTMDESAGSSGSFSPETKQFEVNATFLINFDDTALSEFGFTSPLPLVGTEAGNIYGVGSIGTISMFLAGQGTVAGQTFDYTCQSTAKFEYSLNDDQAQPGDVNHDKALDLSDPIGMLGALFFGQTIACVEAAEVNGDGQFDLSDPVYTLNFLFRGGPATPAEPVPCGR